MYNKYKTAIILSLIFLFAFLLRVINLETLPNSMHADEVVNTFVGRYILLHGTDPNGNFLPLAYFDKFGDYPPVLPMYLSGIATFLFGVTAFASRIPSAFIGSLLIFPVFFLTERFFSKMKAYISAAVLAIFPWHIVLSRASAEGVIALTVFGFALVLFFKGFQENKNILKWLSIIMFGLTYFLYPSFRIITPLTIIPTYFLVSGKKEKVFTIFLSIAFILLTLFISSTTWGKGRFTQTSIFTNPDVSKGIAIDNQIFSNNEGANNVLIARIFHNKVTGYYWVFANNYLSYFSPGFLFSQEGRPDRYVVPQQGLLLLVFLVFILSLFLFRNKKTYNGYFYYLFYLLLISAFPAALTVDDAPNIHRAIGMVIPLTIFTGLGITTLIELAHKKHAMQWGLIAIIIIAIFIQFIYFWRQYTMSQTSYKSVLRNDGNKELVTYVATIKNSYSRVILPSAFSLSAYYLFYTNNFQVRTFGKFLTISHIDNIEFQNYDCPSHFLPPTQINKNILVVDNAGCKPDAYYKVIKTVGRQDGTNAFIVLKEK